MAKILPIDGKKAGKLGGMVYAVYHGLQVVRAAAENVHNPNTPKQIAVRSKMKLLSQLSASLQPVIAIARKGAVSPRNQFTQNNYKYAVAIDDQASFAMSNVQLTAGNRALAGFTAERTANAINVELQEDMSNLFDRIVYVVIRKTTSGQFAPAVSRVQPAAGAGGTFPCALPLVSGDIVICAYGISFASAASKQAFDNYNVETGTDVANLMSSKAINPASLIFSETRGIAIMADASQGGTSGRYNVTLLTAGGSEGGSYQGAGLYAPGEQVTVIASATTTNGQNSFKGWYADAAQEGTPLSTNRQYTFVMGSESKTLYAAYNAGSAVDPGSSDDPFDDGN